MFLLFPFFPFTTQIRLLSSLVLAVTGKLWPKLYEIKVSPVKKPIEEGIIEELCLRRPFKFA